RFAEALAVGGDEIIERRHDIAEADAGTRHRPRAIDAGRNEDGVVTRAQRREAHINAHCRIEMEVNTAFRQERVPARHHRLLELEIGNAVDEETADAIVAVIDMNGVALAPELLGSG